MEGAAYRGTVPAYAALGRNGSREVARFHGGYFGSRLNFAADQK